MGVLDDLRQIRSESTQHETARRKLPGNPPVTVMEDFIGRFSESKGQNNAFRDAIRRGLIDKLKETGSDPNDLRNY